MGVEGDASNFEKRLLEALSYAATITDPSKINHVSIDFIWY